MLSDIFMKRILLLPLCAALAVFVSSCGKQETEAERKAEVDRQVQERLDAEHQADAQKNLDQRQADLDAREQALADKENQPTATPTRAVVERSATPAIVSTESDTGSYATFYRKLDPYGDWMETGDYGYVFQPRQAAQSRDWRPYTNGHWVYTDAGWTWISDEQFGWATYHYGRWVRLKSTGWVWVPGEEWAPAWVSWRKGNDYVGWAPLPPEARFNRETGIHNWVDNYYGIGPEQYAFVPANEFGGAQSASVVVPTERNVTIINQTTNVTNITYNNSTVVDRGPSYDDLRARSRHPIQRLRLERTQNFNDERPVLRGEVVAMPARDFHPAERGARPQRVQRTIAQPTVERGWEGIRDGQAAQKARAKMEAESTPPPNLPPKKFAKPAAPVAAATPAPTATPPATATPAGPIVRPAASAPPAATAAPSAQPSQNPRQEKRRERLREQRNQRPQQTTTPAAATEPPTTTTPTPPFVSPTTTASPTAPATPTTQPNRNPRQEKRRERLLEQRKEKRRERNASAKAAPAATSPPAGSETPEATPSPTPSPTPTATETPARAESNRRPGPRPNP